MSLATDTCFHVSKNPSVQQDRYRLQKSRKKDNYSCYRTILLIIAFDLFKHISHKSCCQGMVWFDADRLVFGRYYVSVVSAGTLACRK